MNRRVYLLWSHREDGPEDLTATDDPRRVPELFEARISWPQPEWPSHEAELARSTTQNEKARAKLIAALDANEIGVTRLFRGWGGTHLQIVDLA